MTGQRIVIHAGARKVVDREIREIRWRLETGETSLVEALTLPILDRAHGLPLAAGRGTAILGHPVKATDLFGDSDRIDHHMWAWPLTDVEVWEPVRPARGAQGFWQWRGE